MRILYVITQQDRGGAQQYVLELAHAFQGLVAAGVEQDSLQIQCAALGVPFTPIPHLVRAVSPLRDIQATVELYRVIKKTKPDIVHANSSKAGVLASIAGFLARVPVVFTAHGFQYLEPMHKLSRWFFWLCELVCRPLRACTITVSEKDRLRAVADSVISLERSQTIYHGLKKNVFEQRDVARKILDIDAATAVIGTIANSYKTKGVDVLLESIAQLKSDTSTCVIVGDGPDMPALKARAKKLGLEARVRFVGQIENAARLLAAFDVFVLPSRKEGFPYALLEALQAGLPIVATSVGGVPELIGTAGVLVPPERPDLLAQALDELLSHSEKRTALGAAALVQSQQYSQKRMHAQTQAVYNTVLANR